MQHLKRMSGQLCLHADACVGLQQLRDSEADAARCSGGPPCILGPPHRVVDHICVLSDRLWCSGKRTGFNHHLAVGSSLLVPAVQHHVYKVCFYI